MCSSVTTQTRGESETPLVPGLAALLARRRDVDASAQLVHGDLAGNVVSDDLLGPGVIDISPYWRPTAYAEAIVIADSVAYGASGLAELEEHLRGNGDQFLIRAVLFRVGAAPDELAAYQAVIDSLLACARPGHPDPADGDVGWAVSGVHDRA